MEKTKLMMMMSWWWMAKKAACIGVAAHDEAGNVAYVS